MADKRRDDKGRILKSGESQRKDGLYQYRYTINKVRKTVYANTLKELREKEDEITKLKLTNRTAALLRPTITLIEQVDAYIATKNNWKHSTGCTMDTARRFVEKQGIGSIRLSVLNRLQMIQFFQTMQENGYSKAYLTNIRYLLYAACQMAIEDDLIVKNPFNFPSGVLKNDQKSRHPISLERWESLLAFMQEDKVCRKHVDIFIVLYETGIRVGELVGLAPRHINFETGFLKIERQYCSGHIKNQGAYFAPPKSQAGNREIPLSELATEAFKRLIAARPEDADEEHLLYTQRQTPMQMGDVESFFRTAANRYNAKHPDNRIYFTPHYMRHSYCSRLVGLGVYEPSIRYTMGHAPKDLTIGVYGHVTPQIAKAHLEAQNAL